MLSISQTSYAHTPTVKRVHRMHETIAVELTGQVECTIHVDIDTWREIIAAVAPEIVCHDAEVKAAEARLAELAETEIEMTEDAETEIAAFASVMAS